MFAQQSEPRERIPGTKPVRRINGLTVTASWTTTAGWIAFEILVPPHRVEAVLWRASIALAFTAGSSCLLVIWCLIRAVIEPMNTQQYSAKMGYRQGYTDGAKDRQARLYVIPEHHATQVHSSNGKP